MLTNILGTLFIFFGIITYIRRKKSVDFQVRFFSSKQTAEEQEKARKLYLVKNVVGSIALILFGFYLLFFF